LAIGFISSPDPNNLLRILLPLVYTVLYANASLKIFFKRPKAIEKYKRYLYPLFILSIPALLGLYTYDLFITCFIITIATLFYDFFTTYKKTTKKIQNTIIKQYLLLGGIQIIIIWLWEIIISLILSGNLTYLLFSLDTIRAYQFIMNVPFSINSSTLFFIYPVSALILFLYILPKSSSTRIISFLLFASLLQLKATFIRSDDGHIFVCKYASLLMLIILFYGILLKKFSGWYVFFLVVTMFLIPYKDLHSFKPSLPNIQSKTFFDIYRLPEDYYLTKKDFDYFNSLISNNKQNVMIFPYENYILNIYGTTYNTLPLQWYDYSNSLVEEKAVERLRKSPPRYIILGIDKKGVVALDNIPNFSRNPLVAKWMLENYSVYANKEKYLILKFDPERKSHPSNYSCNIYDLKTADIMKPNLLEKTFKPSTFYIDTDSGLRLPNMANTSEILLIEKFDNPDNLQHLFERKINFKNYSLKQNRIKIIKKYAPRIEKAYVNNFPVKCY
jgi:hypothetical protein